LGWEKIGEKAFELKKNITNDKKYLAKFDILFQNLDSDKIVIDEAYAIYNLTLLSAFRSNRQIISTRHSNTPGLFQKSDWKDDKSCEEQRNWVYSKYKERVDTYDWNKNLELPIIPAIHGTDEKIAWNICAAGFAALSTLDAGFYGKGIYFSSSCLYTVPYYGTKAVPTILICLLTLGNVRPVIESRENKKGFLGVNIDPGYQSHFVVCKKDGNISPITNKRWYDEIVISAEAQILPIFIIHVQRKCLPLLIANFQREIPDEMSGMGDIQVIEEGFQRGTEEGDKRTIEEGDKRVIEGDKRRIVFDEE